MKIEFEVECNVERDYWVEQLAGTFDLDVEGKAKRSFKVDLPSLDDPWRVGAIVGPSGSGKSVIAREAYGDAFIEGYGWDDRSVVSNFELPQTPKDDQPSIKDITRSLSSVGFSSPPDWLKPYRVLSNGQKFRADLARALMDPRPLIVFDEFTSVVDRQVAQVGSKAVAKAVRHDPGGKRFVGVSCHYDFLAWFEPDWVLDLNAGKLARGWVQREQKPLERCLGTRPSVEVRIHRATRRIWPMFAPHHYLSGDLHVASECYAAVIDERPVAFLATLHRVHPGKRRFRAAHRLVVLPDYQGLGLAKVLLEYVAALESRRQEVDGFRIISSHPALIQTLRHSDRWRCVHWNDGTSRNQGLVARGAAGRLGASSRIRISATFEYCPGQDQ